HASHSVRLAQQCARTARLPGTCNLAEFRPSPASLRFTQPDSKRKPLLRNEQRREWYLGPGSTRETGDFRRLEPVEWRQADHRKNAGHRQDHALQKAEGIWHNGTLGRERSRSHSLKLKLAHSTLFNSLVTRIDLNYTGTQRADHARMHPSGVFSGRQEIKEFFVLIGNPLPGVCGPDAVRSMTPVALRQFRPGLDRPDLFCQLVSITK